MFITYICKPKYINQKFYSYKFNAIQISNINSIRRQCYFAKNDICECGIFSKTTFLTTPITQHRMHSLSSPSSPPGWSLLLLPAFYILTATPSTKVPAAIVSQPQVLVANHVLLPIDQLDKEKGNF